MGDLAIAPAPTPTPAAGGGHAPVDSYAATLPAGGPIPQQQANIAQSNLDTQQTGIAAQTGQNAVQGAQATEAGATAAVPVADQQAAEVSAVHEEAKKRYAQSVDEYQKAQDRANNFKYEDHWAQQGFGTKVQAAISSFLGGFGTGRPVNRAQEWIDRDHQEQKDQLERLVKIAEIKGAEPQHLQELEQSAIRNIDAAYAPKMDALKRKVDAEAARIGTKQAFTNAEKLKADAEQAKLDHEQKARDAMGIHAVAHSLQKLGLGEKDEKGALKRLKLVKTPDGVIHKVYRNPLTGLLSEIQLPTTAPTQAIASTQPPPQVQ